MLRLHEFRYHRPTALDDALALLDRHSGDALPIAGGTDLMPNMKHRLFTPGHVVSLKGVGELRGIGRRGDEIVIGAAESLSTVAQYPLIRAHAPSLARAAGLVAGPQLRNMGTIGGNLCLDTRCTYYNQTHFWRQALGFCLKKEGDTCHVTKVGKKCVAAHSADTPPVLLTLGAIVDLASPRGHRAIAIDDLFIADGIWNTTRQPDEIVTRIRVPIQEPGVFAGFEKLRQRNSIDFPLLNVAVAAKMEDEQIVWIRVVVSALGSRPRVITGLDRVANGQRLGPDLIEEISRRAHQQCHPLSNIIVDPEWRRAMVPVYVRRTLDSLAPAVA